MLPTDHIKERLSLRIIQSIANSLGFEAEEIQHDYGIDLKITEIIERSVVKGKINYIPNREINVQLKATTKKGITQLENSISFNLKVKNYNQIVVSKENLSPIYLFLIVLPENQNEWHSLTEEEVILKSKCYWYIHPDGTDMSNNKTTHKIEIPESQLINVDSINEILTNVYS